ncbi:MAG: PEP-CTERM sorting domain-containing protein [Motiliproteus sp.]
MHSKLTIGLLLLLTTFTGSASATTINFDETGATGNSFLSSDGLVSAQWVFNTGSQGHDHIVSTGGNPGAYESGHGQLFQGIRFSSTGAVPLTLTSFDLRGSWIVGLLNDGSGTQYSAGTKGSGAWTTQAVGLTSLSSIYIYANGQIGQGDLDTVVFGTAVPEAASFLLFGLGLAGIGLSRKKKTV